MKTVQWLKNSVLCTEHLDDLSETFRQYIRELELWQNPFGYGVISMDLDLLSLTKGVVRFKSIHCIFPDRTIVNYKQSEKLIKKSSGEWEMIYDLHLPIGDIFTDHNQSIDIFLCLTGDYVSSSREIINSLGEKIDLNYHIPTMHITTKIDASIGMQVGKIVVKNGAFVWDYFIPPCLAVQEEFFIKKLDKIYLAVNNKLYSIRDTLLTKNQNNLLLVQNNLIQVLHKLDLVIRHKLHPFVIYQYLCESVGLVIVDQLITLPSLPSYNHHNIYGVLTCITDVLFDYIDEGKGSKRLYFTKNEDGYFIYSNSSIVGEQFHILISPVNESLVSQLKICSKSMVEEVQFKRIIGARRNIVRIASNTMIVQVHTQDFIYNNEDIYILGAEPSSQISILQE